MCEGWFARLYLESHGSSEHLPGYRVNINKALVACAVRLDVVHLKWEGGRDNSDPKNTATRVDACVVHRTRFKEHPNLLCRCAGDLRGGKAKHAGHAKHR